VTRPVVVLGATGSIGSQTIEVATSLGLDIAALAARSPSAKLAELATAHPTARVMVAGGSADERAEFAAMVGRPVDFGAGAVIEAARIPGTIVVNGIVGAAGLRATIAGLESANRVALANKESLVAGGPVVKRALTEHGGELIPVDSEHSALLQCLAGEDADSVSRLILTASGGPFRGRSLDSLARVAPEEALAHPTWDMGPRITIDSATLFNKGLEVIEAHHLFALKPDEIDVVVHAQSVIHGLVEFRDGSFIAQLGSPDMRIPIAHCLAWPERIDGPAPRLDLAEVATLSFERPDLERFPALALARRALEAGGGAPTVLNAANEVAVGEFLAKRLGFSGISVLVELTLDAAAGRGLTREPASVDDALVIDHDSRLLTRKLLPEIAAKAS
jgi:1-deoxy-D-xylulose-5-phosphate reductoisomerase